MVEENEAQGSLLEAEKPVETTSWYSQENTEVVERTGWKNPDDAIKGYRELEKNYSSRVKMPTPESSAEEIRAFYQRSGCPENPEGYEITVPENMNSLRDEDMEKWACQQLWEDGAPKQLGENFIRGYYEKLDASMQAAREVAESALKEEWKDKYDENLIVSQRIVTEYDNEEFNNILKTTGFGNNPLMLKFCEWVGRKTTSDTLIKGELTGEKKDEYVPKYKDSPEMYSTGEDEESTKARAYFIARGHKY